MIPYFDAHCDTLSLCAGDGRALRHNAGQLDLARLSAYSKAAQCFAIFHPLRLAPEEGMLAECKRQQALFVRELANNADLAVPCRTGEEIERANAAGKIAALLTCEGSELLNCDPERLTWAHEVGIRMINLTWNHANLLCGSNRHEPERGLNDLGRAFVRRAQALDILIDVSHCSDAAFWDVMQITEKPIVASHSDARAICPHPRNLTDDMFRAIMETGGAVGINYYTGFAGESMDELIAHIDRFMELGGEKHLCLGGDLDGCDALVGGMAGVQDVPALWRALAGRGWERGALEDLFYNNLLRVLA